MQCTHILRISRWISHIKATKVMRVVGLQLKGNSVNDNFTQSLNDFSQVSTVTNHKSNVSLTLHAKHSFVKVSAQCVARSNRPAVDSIHQPTANSRAHSPTRNAKLCLVFCVNTRSSE